MTTRAVPWLKRRLKQISAVLILIGLYLGTRLPGVSARERLALAGNFQFQRSVLPQVPGFPTKTIRAVNPRLARLSAWISSVGASVALNDIDGDGLPNDVCYVDTRT
ncbi:MAG TPA: RNA-binding protein, partial [Candidatus Angelobacter sp.]